MLSMFAILRRKTFHSINVQMRRKMLESRIEFIAELLLLTRFFFLLSIYYFSYSFIK